MGWGGLKVSCLDPGDFFIDEYEYNPCLHELLLKDE